MSEDLFLTTLLMIIGTIVLIFVLKYASAAYQAHARLKSDNAYKDLAKKAATAEAAAAADLAEIKTRLAAVEKMLKEVG